MGVRLHHIVLLLIISTVGFSQQYGESSFKLMSFADGLSDIDINDILQDDQGNMWIGTAEGLNFYDGYTIKQIPDIVPNTQIMGNIFRLKKLGPDKIGIVTYRDFYLLNTSTFQENRLRIAENAPFMVYQNRVWDVERLSSGRLALTTASGFYVLDSTGKLFFRYDAHRYEDVGKMSVRYGRDILPVGNNDYLVYYNIKGVALFDAARNQYRPISTSEKKWQFFTLGFDTTLVRWNAKFQLDSNRFISIAENIDSVYYYEHQTGKTIKSALPFRVGNELNWATKILMLSDSTFVVNSKKNGFWVFHFDPKTGKVKGDGKKFLSNYKINCFYKDRENRLWIGTTTGLLQEKLYKPELQRFTITGDSLKGKDEGALTCIYRYKDKLYAGRYARRNGMVILDTTTMKPVARISFFSNDNQYNEVESINSYHKDTLWIGTMAGVLWFDTRTNRYGRVKELPNTVNMLGPLQKDGYAWLFTFIGKSIYRYHPASRRLLFFNDSTRPKVPFNGIKAVVYDAFGNVWLSGHGLSRWKVSEEKFDTTMFVYAGTNKFDENILAITSDNKGNLWLSNVENGLLQYDIEAKKFHRYTIDDGLPTNNILILSPLIKDHFWVVGRSSLSRFDIASGRFTNYGYLDGLPTHAPTGVSFYHDQQLNYLYLLYQNDIVRFDADFSEPRHNSNGLNIQKIIVNNDTTLFNPSGILELKPDENTLTIQYNVIDYELSNQYKFEYSLNEAKNWIHLGNQRALTLANLNPGRYTLMLKASSDFGIEKIKTLNFVINPPFWKTTWFLLAGLLAAFLSVYFFFRYRVHQLRKKNEIDKQIAQMEIKALHAQMNPHFIFNCLNSIREMILNGENELASVYLSKFAKLIRLTLNQSRNTFVSLKDTIEYLQRYLEMEMIRKEKFTYQLFVDDTLPVEDIMVSPMLFQPFIENAIWHGTLPGKEASINIQFKKKGDQLLCFIEDNGIGIAESLRKKTGTGKISVGIENVRNRLNLLYEKYKMGSSLEIEDKSELTAGRETGTVVKLYLSLNLKDNLWVIS